jgi:nitrite reductase/ring-hydroxylating ferredoxin subunit
VIAGRRLPKLPDRVTATLDIAPPNAYYLLRILILFPSTRPDNRTSLWPEVNVLSVEDNELLCRVEGDAAMGQLMRCHWIPACLSEEVAERDGAPVRVRLLGEDLVAFRDTTGRLGVLDEHCPHRRASLALGRNEESGLRCLYHGWKIDVQGNVVDRPCEAHEAVLAKKVVHQTYPCRDRQRSSHSSKPSVSVCPLPCALIGK